MTRSFSIMLGLLLSMFVAAEANAQWNVARFDTDRSRVYTTFGLDPASIGSLGYGRVLSLRGHDFQLTGDLGVVTAGMDARDFRARVGTQTSLVQWRSVHLTGSATFVTRNGQLDLPGIELRCRPDGIVRCVSAAVVHGR